MDWLQTLDIELFRFINLRLINPVCDVVMPFVSGNVFFRPLLLLAGILLIRKGRARGVVCLLMLVVLLPLGDGLIYNTVKHAVGRPRPFMVMPDVHRPGRNPDSASMAPSAISPGEKSRPPSDAKGDYTSMPSSHAANWFAATMILFIYYRRSLWFMLPGAILVSFSRIYNGAHYPGDVTAGAILGAGYAAASVWTLTSLWVWAGQRWFPLWWRKFPSLLNPALGASQDENEESEFPMASPSSARTLPGAATRARLSSAAAATSANARGQPPVRRSSAQAAAAGDSRAPHVTLDQHWLRLGYVVLAALLVARLAYIGSAIIELSRDEAYQWLWSKHLALSYYSKPPLIAYTQFLGTFLWGDTAFGVRFFSPVIGAVLGLLVLRFFAREVNARAGFFLLLIITATPLTSVGAVLMTVDPLSVLFWTAAMLAGWRAVQANGTARQWLWVGLWMGLGFLSKYTALFQLLCWAVFFVLWPAARKHLRRPGPYLAVLVNLVCALPVLIWNSQQQWVTVSAVAANAGLESAWKPTLRYLFEFIGAEAGLLNPIFFVATVWAAIAFWRRGRYDPRLVYLFSMGAPLFLSYLLYSLRSRILPNWIAPSVLPLFCLMVIYWDTRWRLGATRIKPWLISGLVLGLVAVFLCHDTNLITKLTGARLPVNQDPLHRVRGWSGVARAAGEARQVLLAEGKPVFIIGDHYSMVGEIAFYLPEAKATVTGDPLIFYRSDSRAINQFHFWPGYEDRKGQNAIFVRELDRDLPRSGPVPREVVQQFESVTEMGITNVLYHRRTLWPIQIFACRGLR
ncbi:MAG: glycosyltransferase family 39 protein [Verrucomicrobia bacterium]|nr:glycosyltransferase family 39 protein [Verrucomicrobiota bacterium]